MMRRCLAHIRRILSGSASAPIWKERYWISDFLKIVKPMKPILVFDCGTNRGQILDQLLKAMPEADFYAFEPIPELASGLRSKYASYDRIHIEQTALGAENATREFHVNNYDETSSFLNATKYFEDRRYLSTARRIHVPMTRVDRYCQVRNISLIHLIKLDVQGYELEVLKGCGDKINEIVAVYAEVNFVEVYENQPEFFEIDRFLHSKGFRLYNFYHLSSSVHSGQILAGDVMWANRRIVPYETPREPWEDKLECR